MKTNVSTLKNKRVVMGAPEDEHLVTKNEVIIEAFDDKFRIKERNASGVMEIISIGEDPNNFTKLLTEANHYYKLTAGEEGGTHAFSGITGSNYILVCTESTSGKCTVSVVKVTSSGVSTSHGANEVAYVALYSSVTPSGTESGVTKTGSTKAEFEEKIAFFI